MLTMTKPRLWCPCCGTEMDVIIQEFEMLNRRTTCGTCFNKSCSFVGQTVSDTTLQKSDVLLNRYHVESKFDTLTGELLP